MSTIKEYIRAYLKPLLIVSLLMTITTIILAIIWLKTGDSLYEPFILILLGLSGLIGVPSIKEWISKDTNHEPDNLIIPKQDNLVTHEQGNLTTVKGEIRLDQAGDNQFSVFYPKPFLRKPHFVALVVAGENNFQIKEQREDGFIIVRGGASSGSPIRLKWTATGELA